MDYNGQRDFPLYAIVLVIAECFSVSADNNEPSGSSNPSQEAPTMRKLSLVPRRDVNNTLKSIGTAWFTGIKATSEELFEGLGMKSPQVVKKIRAPHVTTERIQVR